MMMMMDTIIIIQQKQMIWRRIFLVFLLLLALWFLTDDETNNNPDVGGESSSSSSSSSSIIHNNNHHRPPLQQQQNHHLAVWTALKRHPPSLRVFRSLLEIDLILWGAAFSLWVWSKTIGQYVVAKLLFGPLKEEEEEEEPSDHHHYQQHHQQQHWYKKESNHGSFGPHDSSDGEYLTENNHMSEEINFDGGEEEEEDEQEQEHDHNDKGENIDAFSPTKTDRMDMSLVDNNQQQIHHHHPCHHQRAPPDATLVLGAALDLLLLILLSLFFFTWSSAEGGRYIDGMSTFQLVTNIAAPTVPLILFFVTVVAIVWWHNNRKRRKFWKVISYTIMAPLYPVDFRDGFIGDILTSSVCPMQDVAYTIFYLLSGLRGWWSKQYDLDDAAGPVDPSWLLHTVILPMCMVSPLWWRFLQTLRQAYDYQKRWPYLGNATKYMVAAEVAMLGIFDPNRRNTTWWITCFVMATLYQIWWDVFMDWELFTFSKASILPQLRVLRAYRYRWMYWVIFFVNLVLRFGWTWSFMPARYLTQAGVLRETVEQRDLRDILWPAIASAEIIRRSLWGLLRVELEAIKTCRHELHHIPTLSYSAQQSELDHEMEMQPMSIDGAESNNYSSVFSTLGPNLPVTMNSDKTLQGEQQLLTELGLWVIAFGALGMLAAVHRATL